MQPKSATKQKEKQTAPPEKQTGVSGLFFLVGAVALATLICFIPAISNSFISWDDNTYVFENEHLSKQLPDAIKYFFQLHYFLGSYTPLTMTVFALEMHTGGLDPQFFHTINILLHVVNAALVFGFIYLLSGRKKWVAAIVALLFGIHPMHAESVMWVSELKDVLYSLFFLAGLITYYKYLEAKTATITNVAAQNKNVALRMWVITFILFVLSVLSKPTAVTFPIVLLLLDFYTHRKFDKWVVLEKIPFLIVSVVMGIITMNGQSTYDLMRDAHTFPQRLLFASYAFITYVQKLLLPAKLSIFYPYPDLTDGALTYWVYFTPVLVIALFLLVYKTLKNNRFIAFGFLFFFVTIFLTLQVVSDGLSIIADHYTYIPYIGLFFIIAMGFDRLYNSDNPKLKTYKQVAVAVILLFSVACASVTHSRSAVWLNDETIADDLLKKFPNDEVAVNNKGFSLLSYGRPQEAIPYFIKALQLRPSYPYANVNLANAYIAIKDYDNAIKAIIAAENVLPANADVLTTKGYYFLLQKNYPAAIQAYEQAIAVNPKIRNAYLGLAQCYYDQKDNAAQIQILTKALERFPDNYLMLNNKGYALMLTGKYEEAIPLLEESLRQKPGYQLATENLSMCYKAIANRK